MSKTFDLSTLNLSVGTHEITVKARANGYLDSEPSNKVYYVVSQSEEPETQADMIIENLYMGGDIWENVTDYGQGILNDYTPTSIETDENGNTVFAYETLALKIVVTGITDQSDLTQPLLLKKGQHITFYPFDMESQQYEDSQSWKYTVVIPEQTNGILYCNGNYGIWNSGVVYWKYAPITIEFSYDSATGNGTITAKDRDGMGNTKTDVDFTQGVTIVVD